MKKQEAEVSELGVPLRKRVAKACDQCRRRKTKCDGKLQCSNCNSIGLRCSYGDQAKQMRGQAYVVHLERRVEELQNHVVSNQTSYLPGQDWYQPYEPAGGLSATASSANHHPTTTHNGFQWPSYIPGAAFSTSANGNASSAYPRAFVHNTQPLSPTANLDVLGYPIQKTNEAAADSDFQPTWQSEASDNNRTGT